MAGGLFGGGGGGQSAGTSQSPSNVPGASVYTPQGQPQADQQYQALLASLGGQYQAGTTPGQYAWPLAQQAETNVAQNPYAQLQQQGAAGVAPWLQQAGADATTRSWQYGDIPGQVNALAGPLAQGAGSILNTAFDPQNALHDQLQQQTGDRSNAINSMYGLGSSPYGAGLASDASRNFNIDWQNQQLARQTQGLASAGAASGQAANLYGQVPQLSQALLGLAQGGANAYMQGSGLPYQTSINQSQQALPALQTGSAIGQTQYQLPQQILNDLQSYLGLGQSASAYSGALGNQGFNQNALGAAGLATLGNQASPFLFGSGGAAGALGLPQQTGLLGGIGNLFSSIFSSPASVASVALDAVP